MNHQGSVTAPSNREISLTRTRRKRTTVDGNADREEEPAEVSSYTEDLTKFPRYNSNKNEILFIHIVSAFYGRCEDSIPVKGGLCSRSNTIARREEELVSTRDVTVFLREWLQEEEKDIVGDQQLLSSPLLRISAIVGNTGARRRRRVNLTGQNSTCSMNAIFGDPCPGYSKQLQIEYMVWDSDGSSQQRYRVSFAEHEPIVLKRYPYTASTQLVDDEQETATCSELKSTYTKRISGMVWTETVLLLILPYLDIPTRLQCQRVSRHWRHWIQTNGVATTIDARSATARSSWRLLLKVSYSSLIHLFLGNVIQLRKQDLHPSLPFLTNLETLDLSFCTELDDTTMELIAQPQYRIHSTLRVLYIKHLQRVTDHGLYSICQRCLNLQVLDISFLRNLTDTSILAIGQHLRGLRALYMKENFKVSSEGVNAVTQGCPMLEELTIWGLNRFDSLSSFGTTHDNNHDFMINKRLVLLNLSECFGLGDELADTLSKMVSLRSLVVNGCFRLSDSFVLQISVALSQLQHLSLRFCQRITDTAVNAIRENMKKLFSLDLSFCTDVSAGAIGLLLHSLAKSLAELRLERNLHLDLVRVNGGRFLNGDSRRGAGAHALLTGLFNSEESCLNLLDVRQCADYFPEEEELAEGLSRLGFKQIVVGCFTRPAQCMSVSVMTEEDYPESLFSDQHRAHV